jgi:plasmid stability protein
MDKALTVRVPEDLAKRLRIQAALTGESTNALCNRLLVAYLDGEGRAAALSVAADRTAVQYAAALEKLA